MVTWFYFLVLPNDPPKMVGRLAKKIMLCGGALRKFPEGKYREAEYMYKRVTATYHMRRSLAIARYLFPGQIDIVPCPADDDNTNRDNWMNTPKGVERATREALNIIRCVKNGVIPDFEI